MALARDRELGRWSGNLDATGRKFIALPLQVGDEAVDFFLGKDAPKRRHTGLRPTVGDAAPNVGFSPAMVPKIVEQVGRRDAGEVSAVTIHADLGDDFSGARGGGAASAAKAAATSTDELTTRAERERRRGEDIEKAWERVGG